MKKRPYKMKAGKGGPMLKNFGILGPKSKQLINKVKKAADSVGDKVKNIANSFSTEEIEKRRNQRYRDYVKKSNKNPEKYPAKSSDEVY